MSQTQPQPQADDVASRPQRSLSQSGVFREIQQRAQEQARREAESLAAPPTARLEFHRQGGEFAIVVRGGNLWPRYQETLSRRQAALQEARLEAARKALAGPEHRKHRDLAAKLAETEGLIEGAKAKRAKALADARQALATGDDPEPFEAEARQASQDEHVFESRLTALREFTAEAKRAADAAVIAAAGAYDGEAGRRHAAARARLEKELWPELVEWLTRAVADDDATLDVRVVEQRQPV